MRRRRGVKYLCHIGVANRAEGSHGDLVLITFQKSPMLDRGPQVPQARSFALFIHRMAFLKHPSGQMLKVSPWTLTRGQGNLCESPQASGYGFPDAMPRGSGPPSQSPGRPLP